MNYFATIGKREYEISIKKTDVVGRTFLSVMVDGEEFVIDFWRTPDSPFVLSS